MILRLTGVAKLTHHGNPGRLLLTMFGLSLKLCSRFALRLAILAFVLRAMLDGLSRRHGGVDATRLSQFDLKMKVIV